MPQTIFNLFFGVCNRIVGIKNILKYNLDTVFKNLIRREKIPHKTN